MKRRTMLAGLALGVGGAAVAGYGAAMGRDAWRVTKKNALFFICLALIACAIVLPFQGGRNLTRGYSARQKPPIFTSLIRIFGGGLLGLLGTVAPQLYLSNSGEPADKMLTAFLLISGLTAASTGLGLLFGASQKSKRLRTFEIAAHNERFLDDFGFEELDGTEVTHMDGEGNPLRVTERNDESIVFLAVGRRNRRAYILLTPEGQMLGYTGVIALTEPRLYRDSSGQPIAA